ncbi:MAG: excinuclease ABC subunit UvrA [Candidatus Margulisiibacteriota bacterium]
MPDPSKIVIRGARTHNLKNIDLEIPRNKLVVLTGLSGSGKSSLAIDTLYAEGQRRYVESLSAYARQFLEQMQKPDVDSIDGLSPAISIEQKAPSRNPRSTVGTVTELYDFLRLLYASIGTPYCYKCGKKIEKQSASQITDNIIKHFGKKKIMVLSPVTSGKKGEHRDLIESLKKEGFVRIRVDGTVFEIGQDPKLDKKKKHSIEVVVDRLSCGSQARGRLFESVETALKLGRGSVLIAEGKNTPVIYSENFACAACGISLGEISPRIFSFNNPYGACPNCTGLGSLLMFDPDLVIPDRTLSINEGAIEPWKSGAPYYMHKLEALAKKMKFSLDTPVKDLTKEQLDTILNGTGGEKMKFRYTYSGGYSEYEDDYEGVLNHLDRRYKETDSENVRFYLYRFMSPVVCKECGGARLKPESLSVKINGLSIADASSLSIEKLGDFIKGLNLSKTQLDISRQILKEINARLKFLSNVGLDYLTLNRQSWTLSGGEAQRTRLATQIGSGLVGVMYILDEPSVGLHQRDNERLINTLKDLRDLGNTVIVVEHDEEIMKACDHIIDIGPGAGVHGGRVVSQGSPQEVSSDASSVTGKYLSGRESIRVPDKRRKGSGKTITIKAAAHHNLKKIDISIPLSTFTAVTGVSGSGKSSLINEVLYRELARQLYRSTEKPGKFSSIHGIDNIDKVIIIDQSPIGRTPRSNPATYTKAFDHIRDLFSMTEEARVRGYQKGRFSFNVKGGRCETCGGGGLIKIEMHFLPDVYIPCEECKGKRYNPETLEVKFKGRSIAEVLDMTVEEAYNLFEKIPRVSHILRTLMDVGLSYIHLGQAATTLSGGEAQRIKLSAELSHRSTGRTLYILDEPTTGLHFDDIKKLLEVLQRLVDAGNTVVVIEHNLDVIKSADHLIDLGPEGGDKGGYLVAQGTPEVVSSCKKSYTGQYLARSLYIRR